MQGWRRNKGIKGHDRMKLGELGTFKTGGTPSRSKNEYWGDKYPWISSTALGDVYIDENAATDWVSDEGLKNSSTKLIKANSLMIGIRIGVGKCSINRIPMCTSQDVVSIEGIDTERYYLPYITTLINNKRHYLESLKRGATIQGITTDIIKNLQIPDIQINRQKLIADTIQVVDDMVCLSHKQLAKLDTLVKSRFIEMFGDPVTNPMGWEVKPLQEVVAEDCTISYGIVQTGNPQKEGVPVFRPVDIVGHYPHIDELKKTTRAISDKYKRTLLHGGELLITVRANIADTCIIGNEFAGCNVGRGIVPLRFNPESINKVFLKAQIDNHGVNCALKGLAKGITLIQLNMEDLRQFPLIVPPIALQNQFANFVQLADKSKSVLQKLLEKQELLRAALMQEYFG